MKLNLVLLIILLTTSLYSEEYKFEMKGVKASLISEVSAIKPGDKFTVALYLQHFDDFHTYWKNPGLVGFATSLNWELPEGFKAGEIQWQVPERSKMLKYNCHAYKGDAYLLIDLQAPKIIPEKFELKAKVGGMSCSTKSCCKIGFIDVALEILKAEKTSFNESAKAKIDQARKRIPKHIPSYTVEANRVGEFLKIKLSSPALSKNDIEELYFFSNENITDTESEQQLKLEGDSATLTIKLNKYVPEQLDKISGYIYNKLNWKGSEQQYLPFEVKVK